MLTRTRSHGDSRLREELDRAHADLVAVGRVQERLARIADAGQAAQTALDVVRESFGWVYGSYWTLDEAAGVLVFGAESGRASEEFRRLSAGSTFARGVGLNGRAWAAGELVAIPDLSELTDCVRAPVARQSGIRSGLCFPLHVDGEVVATMDFFTDEVLDLGEDRRRALTVIGTLLSGALASAAEGQRQAKAAQDTAATSAVLRAVITATSAEEALTRALDTIRREFGWAYGSYWSIDQSDQQLHFAQESGDAGEEFRSVTRSASFAEGVGLAGRAWRQREMVFVPDLAEVTDCVRAPVARRAGVQSGVCLPILVDDQVVGTMDFFATWRLVLSPGREAALRDTAFIVGQALQRLAAAERLHVAGEELVTSIEEVERNVVVATDVATEGQRLTAQADEVVAGLGRSSEEIGGVVRTIHGIASQTNLLALNATIEAARAGEAGRGFAVVAGEVKDLANETARATTQVQQRVTAIQVDVEQAVAALAAIRETVDRINETQQVISAVLTEQAAVTRSIVS